MARLSSNHHGIMIPEQLMTPDPKNPANAPPKLITKSKDVVFDNIDPQVCKRLIFEDDVQANACRRLVFPEDNVPQYKKLKYGGHGFRNFMG